MLALEDGTGQVPTGERYDYDPYGELDTEPIDPEAAANPFRFEGFYYDSGVRSYDMHARAYRPEHGRFLSQDRYASASQDLLLHADPLTRPGWGCWRWTERCPIRAGRGRAETRGCMRG